MKLANFEHNGLRRIGLVARDEVADLTAFLGSGSGDVVQFLAMGEAARRQASQCLSSATPRMPLASVKLCAPVARIDKIFGVGMSYRSFVAAAQRVGMPVPATRPWFQRPASCITDPHGDIWLPAGATDLDYEGELAIVIGRRCRDVDASDAANVIGGFMVANDLTLRERAKRSLALSKSFDTHTPIGPWIVTPDEIDYARNLSLNTWVNGQLRQQSSTADLAVSCEELIAELSKVCTLNAGDIILTGTPDGCGIFQQPPSSLGVGDVVRIAIEGIGSIENRVVPTPPLETVEP